MHLSGDPGGQREEAEHQNAVQDRRAIVANRPHTKPIWAREHSSRYQNRSISGKSGSALKAETPLASIAVVMAMDAMTPSTGSRQALSNGDLLGSCTLEADETDGGRDCDERSLFARRGGPKIHAFDFVPRFQTDNL